MRILLIGEYSNVHWGLACGLRQLGHKVMVVSNGDFWKGYSTDIKLVRHGQGKLGGLRYLLRLLCMLPRLRGYDIVQIINPMFLELKAERIAPIYRYLRRHNGKMILAAYGMDLYYLKACLETDAFAYSELAVSGKFRDIADNRSAVADWKDGEKGKLNTLIAKDCDGIDAGLWEYWKSYMQYFPDKTFYVPFAVAMPASPAERYLETGAEGWRFAAQESRIAPCASDSAADGCASVSVAASGSWASDSAEVADGCASDSADHRIRFFIGIQKSRSEFKGTDILLDVLTELEAKHPSLCTVVRAENVPFAQYSQMMRSCDVLVDQLYSPTPNMNSLLAMSQGIAVCGGGELEPYSLINEDHLHPVINLPCSREEVLQLLESLVLDPSNLQQLKSDSILYVSKHHAPASVASMFIADI